MEIFDEYIYLIITTPFLISNQNIYKIGKTTQLHFNRFKQYPKNSRLLFYINTNNCDTHEKQIITLFKQKYQHCPQYGHEYFKGDYRLMIQDISNFIHNNNIPTNTNINNYNILNIINNKQILDIIDNNTINQEILDIIQNQSLTFKNTDICKYLKVLAGKKFIYINDNIGTYKLYCYNGKIWKNDDVIMKNFISNEMYEFLKTILIELYFEHPTFNKMKNQIKRLKNISFKKDIVETYKEVGTNNNITFDNNPYLFGFNNTVYDLLEGQFRDYRYDDYISITTGYDWREPTQNELDTIHTLITQIMPYPDERELYLQILATSLDGKCLEKFIVFDGNGGNGKGMMDDLLLNALGNYAMIGNNAILFETNKTGSNPEKANIHKKRLVIFREPPEKNKFENSVIKELTGGGTFSARGHQETNTKKELNLTMIIECNKRPLFAEEPGQAEIRRLIDIYFRATYTDNPSLVDHSKHIYLANPHYKTNSFQNNHKYALLNM